MVTQVAGPLRYDLTQSPAAWLAIKLVALVLMVADHADWGLYGSGLGIHETAGRVVFPLFALVLGRSVTLGDPHHLLRVVVPRMLGVGVVASFAYVPLFGWYPLNVMFTLAAGVAMVAAWRAGWMLVAVSIFAGAGLLVDYQWFGLACVALSAWAFATRLLPVPTVLAIMALLLLPVNGNLVASMAVLVAWLASYLQGSAPRLKWLFYAAYPGHLAVLAAASVL